MKDRLDIAKVIEVCLYRKEQGIPFPTEALLQQLYDSLTWNCHPSNRLYDFEDFGPYFGEEPRGDGDA